MKSDTRRFTGCIPSLGRETEVNNCDVRMFNSNGTRVTPLYDLTSSTYSVENTGVQERQVKTYGRRRFSTETILNYRKRTRHSTQRVPHGVPRRRQSYVLRTPLDVPQTHLDLYILSITGYFIRNRFPFTLVIYVRRNKVESPSLKIISKIRGGFSQGSP